MDEDRAAHLAMIQGVIDRMGGNALAVKTWSVGLVAALFAVAGQSSGGPSPVLFFTALGGVVVFTLLDCAYLRQERLFRHLYEAVAKGDDPEKAYSMDTKTFRGRPNVRWSSLFWSWSVAPLYLSLAVTTVLVGLVLTGCP